MLLSEAKSSCSETVTPLTQTAGSSKRGRSAITPEVVPSVQKKPKSDASGNLVTETPITETSDELPWTTIVKRRQQEPKKTTTEQAGKAAVLPKMASQTRHKTEAIVVGLKEKESYADILRRVKADPKLQSLGKQVSKVRRTREGNLIFELKRDNAVSGSDFKDLLQDSVGEVGQVTVRGNVATLEIRDIDEVTSPEDVERALKARFELGTTRLDINIKPAFNGTQTACIKMAAKQALLIAAAREVEIDWSICRIHILPQSRRCFRCWEYNHVQRDCKGPDRRNNCLRCGEEGHQARTCTKPAVVVEEKGDVVILSEPYQAPKGGSNNWVSDKTGKAAIWAAGRFPIQRVVSCTFEGFVIAEVNGVCICSSYAPPSWELKRFNEMLDNLVAELSGISDVIIAGDFNAWAVEWGSIRTNNRGEAILESFARLNVVLGNVGSTPTFSRNDRTSIIDITFCSPVLAQHLNWRVSDTYTLSDHRVVRYSIGKKRITLQVPSNKMRGWKTRMLNKELFLEALNFGDFGIVRNAPDLVAALSTACDATMPRRKPPRHSRTPAYWWDSTIAKFRSDCLAARRKMQPFTVPESEPEPITVDEILRIADRLKPGKAPGPDGLPNEAVMVAMKAYPAVFQTVLQTTLLSGQFPSLWKKQKLVLIPKPGKPPGDPSAFRPLGLIDTMAKVQEMTLLDRLVQYTEGEHGLSERQFGFRKKRSTVDAVLAVLEKACPDADETAEHVMFGCPRFIAERQQLNDMCDTEVGHSNLVQLMLQNSNMWEAASSMMRQVVTKLQRWWREDQMHGLA
ncbi:uncharacterized protein LOC125774492 [Anopheles funestus]|uniref:uncharacterized protein LOC125774492 n=1 Tax=Anopheles funestus TaxID=62324 RepID=UPI0020C5CB29|nr:uncharacterized protein LOC125774492 [Anopheles funestus]